MGVGYGFRVGVRVRVGVSQAVHTPAAHEARCAAHEGVYPLGQCVAGHLVRVRVSVRVGVGVRVSVRVSVRVRVKG